MACTSALALACTLPSPVPLPEGVTEADIAATYKDGILEIRVPEPKAVRPRR